MHVAVLLHLNAHQFERAVPAAVVYDANDVGSPSEHLPDAGEERDDVGSLVKQW
jgi:hypothetical protein